MHSAFDVRHSVEQAGRARESGRGQTALLSPRLRCCHQAHTAKEDETPVQISDIYNVPVSALIQLNSAQFGADFTPSCRLRAGAQLVIQCSDSV